MFWASIIIGSIVVVIVLVVVIGLALPKVHSASVTARYKQPPEEIFEAISDWRGFPKWRGDLKSVKERAGEAGRVSWIEIGRMGEMPLEVLESDPPRKLVCRIASNKLPFGGTWTYQIEPTADGCTLAITEDGEVYNPIFRFMARFFFGYAATLRAYHAALSRKFAQACEQLGG